MNVNQILFTTVVFTPVPCVVMTFTPVLQLIELAQVVLWFHVYAEYTEATTTCELEDRGSISSQSIHSELYYVSCITLSANM